MIRLIDAFLIAVPKIFDDGDGPIKNTNTAFFVDKERDRYERKVRKGIVYSAPAYYREERHMPIDRGIPAARGFVGHDAIQSMVNQGYNWGNERYHPGATDEIFDWLSRADYGKRITAKEGDKVHFHPSVTEPDNFFGEKDGNLLYIAQVHELIAVGSIPQGYYILVEPIPEDKEFNGIIVAVDDTHKLLQGIARTGEYAGERVFFQEGSDWPFEIEGKVYFAMLEENILATGDLPQTLLLQQE